MTPTPMQLKMDVLVSMKEITFFFGLTGFEEIFDGNLWFGEDFPKL